MSGRFKVPTLEEVMARRKSKKGKGKETELVERPLEITTVEPNAEPLKLSTGASQSSKKRKVPIEPEDLENVIIKIPRSATIMSDPSGLSGFAEKLLLEEDECRLTTLGPIEASKRAVARAYETLECAIFQQKYVEASQRRIRDVEKSNTELRKELAEARSKAEELKKMSKEAEKEKIAAQATLKVEREMMSAEIDAYKDSLKKLEEDKEGLIEQMETVAFEAMIKERSSLMDQFLKGEHVAWNPMKWIRLNKKLEAGESFSSDEDEVKTGIVDDVVAEEGIVDKGDEKNELGIEDLAHEDAVKMDTSLELPVTVTTNVGIDGGVAIEQD